MSSANGARYMRVVRHSTEPRRGRAQQDRSRRAESGPYQMTAGGFMVGRRLHGATLMLSPGKPVVKQAGVEASSSTSRTKPGGIGFAR